MATITQLRALGGVIGLSLTSNLLNNHVRDGLDGVLSPRQLDAILRPSAIVDMLPGSLQSVVRGIYSEWYNLQMKVMIGFSAAQILGVGLMWERTVRKMA
ncbi:hypothetical protein MMC16_004768 [Acarospora aff. strigata]|nr:hypothetical protein [Acarospora aff. strigata]